MGGPSALAAHASHRLPQHPHPRADARAHDLGNRRFGEDDPRLWGWVGRNSICGRQHAADRCGGLHRSVGCRRGPHRAGLRRKKSPAGLIWIGGSPIGRADSLGPGRLDWPSLDRGLDRAAVPVWQTSRRSRRDAGRAVPWDAAVLCVGSGALGPFGH